MQQLAALESIRPHRPHFPAAPAPNAYERPLTASERRVVTIVDAASPGLPIDDRACALGVAPIHLTLDAGSLELPRSRCTIVNLADSDALPILRNIARKHGTSADPVLAYSRVGSEAKACWLGRIDVLTVPRGIEHVARVLDTLGCASAHGRRPQRVVTLSTDEAVLPSLHGRLAKDGFGTLAVFGLRQAIDLLGIFKPEAALFHLSPRSQDVFGTITELRRDPVTAGVPIAFAIDPKPSDRDGPYTEAGFRFLRQSIGIPVEDLTTKLAAAIGMLADPLNS